MASLICTDVTIGHGPIVLAEGINLTVAPGAVIGLVGQNGGGKTTLLRMLAGLLPPVSGRVARAPSSATVGYLAQQLESACPEESIAQWLGRRTGVTAATHAMEAAADALGRGEPAGNDYGDRLDEWLALGGADFEDRIPAALADVGLTLGTTAAPQDGIVSALSGGQKARVGLAALLLARFDVFLLDEPTNDLDLQGLARLERLVGELRNSGAAIVVVSHDRTFLETVTTDVVELDPVEGRASVFGGGYTAYLREREVARQHAEEAYDEYRERHDDLMSRAQTTRDWASKGVRKSRSDLRKKGMDPDKIGRKAKADASEKQAGKASRLEKSAERLEEVAEPRKVWELRYSIEAAPRSGSVVATIRDAVVERGSFRLGPLHLDLAYGERVAITGPNGAGKTTLLQMLLGRLAPTSGSAALGSGVVIGEVDQSRAPIEGDATLVDAFLGWYPTSTMAEVRTLLAKFGLSGDDVARPAHSLSPGERTRAALARFQHDGVNLLVLDEPTNHLDLPAIEQLESALANYPGTLLLVSHDRRLLESVTVDRRWHVEAGIVTESA
jgi:ATPase subunit of ABC transporter with duplicated ATPase domains